MKREKAGLIPKGILGNASTKSHTNCPVMCIRHMEPLDLFLFFVALKREQ